MKIERGTCVFFSTPAKGKPQNQENHQVRKERIKLSFIYGGFPGFVKHFRHSSKSIIFIPAIFYVYFGVFTCILASFDPPPIAPKNGPIPAHSTVGASPKPHEVQNTRKATRIRRNSPEIDPLWPYSARTGRFPGMLANAGRPWSISPDVSDFRYFLTHSGRISSILADPEEISRIPAGSRRFSPVLPASSPRTIPQCNVTAGDPR